MELGFPRTDVLPVVPTSRIWTSPPTALIAGPFDDGWTNLMFVGRVIPNKKFENVIRIFHAYKQRHNLRSRLLLVGSSSGFERYFAMLQELIADLGVRDVHFLGHVTNAELAACYEVADLFLCASEHEGFCVPLMEAFHAGCRSSPTRPPRSPPRWTAAACSTARHPAHVAAVVDAVLDDADLENRDRRGAGRGARTAPARDFPGPARGFVEQVLAMPPQAAPPVAFDFWDASTFTQQPRGAAPVPARRLRRAAAESRRAAMIINQWVPAAHRGDAIGDSARRVRDLLREKGHGSDLFALTIDDDLRDDVRPFSDPAARTGDVTIFHFALPSPMTAAFATLPGARVLQYHNITPAHFFAPYDAGTVPAGVARPAGAGDARRPRRSRRSATRTSTAGSSRPWASRRPG